MSGKHTNNEKLPLYIYDDLENKSYRVISTTNPDDQEAPEEIIPAGGTNQHQAGSDEMPESMPETKAFNFFKITRSQKCILLFCSFANFVTECTFALMVPFFPMVAEGKGVSQTMIGFIFSVQPLTVFLLSPFIGKYMTKIGVKFVYIAGIFVGGVASMLFGTLINCPGGAVFIVMCVACRSVAAMGFAGFINTSMTIVSNEFPDHVGTVCAFLESVSGFGFMFGPVLGGWLYDLGGYELPFYATGSLVLANGLLLVFAAPGISQSSVREPSKVSMLRLLRSPSVWMALMGMFVAVSGVSALDSTMANHLNSLGLSPAIIGLIYVINPTVYTVTTPFWGYLTDVKGFRSSTTFLGFITFAIAFLLCGPSHVLPFVPFELWVVAVGCSLLGVSCGCLYIAAMKGLVVAAYDLKYEKSQETFAVVSGIFNSVMAFGGFVGPFAGGAVVQRFRYPSGYTAVSAYGTVALLLFSIFSAYQYLAKRKMSLK